MLYLDVQPSREKSKTLELLYSLAAGVAMFISILLGFLVVEDFSGNTYMYFTLLIVVYMLKDRFKEWIRNVSNHFVQKIFQIENLQFLIQHTTIKLELVKNQ